MDDRTTGCSAETGKPRSVVPFITQPRGADGVRDRVHRTLRQTHLSSSRRLPGTPLYRCADCLYTGTVIATWDSFPTNKLCKISPKLQHCPPLHHSYSRKEQVILNRLLIGHIHLTTLKRLLIGHTHLTHSCLLNKEQPPNCNYCKSLLTRILEKSTHTHTAF